MKPFQGHILMFLSITILSKRLPRETDACAEYKACLDPISDPHLRMTDDSSRKLMMYFEEFCANVTTVEACLSRLNTTCGDREITETYTDDIFYSQEHFCTTENKNAYIAVGDTACITNQSLRSELIQTIILCATTGLTGPSCSQEMVNSVETCFRVWANTACGKNNAALFWLSFAHTKMFKAFKCPQQTDCVSDVLEN
ncbi:hypothetical protein PoB_001846100 [Plakobranchus ocellatus]|uniref:DUF19 domain-containing protein n=1 Tax=Plakobranchus ocellatus TaxID=259542 RepID=A0AAV3YXZ4_9GAST|nr:hypothetical protein PoB_001846100 [Plakobranchus ocellatus]